MSDSEIVFEPFPKQKQFMDKVFSGEFLFLLYGGAIKGGKTIVGLVILIILCRIFPGSRWAVVRADLPSIIRNVFPNLDKVLPVNFVLKDRRNSARDPHIEFKNRSKIIFFAENYTKDKELNRWKGLDVNGFLLEELNELQKASFLKAIERAGTYIIPKIKVQPEPIIIGTCNPSRGWVKQEIYDKWEENDLPADYYYLPANIYDNPYISESKKRSLKNLPKYHYMVFVEGNWNVNLKTGGEFLKAFELDKHLKVTPKLEEAYHISIDANVLPYVGITVYQIIKTDSLYDVYQVHEIPARDPDNTAISAGRLTGKWLNSVGYKSKVFLYGDPSTKSRNAIDPQKRSFYDLFVKGLEEKGHEIKDRFFTKAPIVSATGDFINDILDKKYNHIRLWIGEDCTESINDYIDCKEDPNGGILKRRTLDSVTNQSYEKTGHLLDTLRYFICKAFESDFKYYTKDQSFGFSHGQLSQMSRKF